MIVGFGGYIFMNGLKSEIKLFKLYNEIAKVKIAGGLIYIDKELNKIILSNIYCKNFILELEKGILIYGETKNLIILRKIVAINLQAIKYSGVITLIKNNSLDIESFIIEYLQVQESGGIFEINNINKIHIYGIYFSNSNGYSSLVIYSIEKNNIYIANSFFKKLKARVFEGFYLKFENEITLNYLSFKNISSIIPGLFFLRKDNKFFAAFIYFLKNFEKLERNNLEFYMKENSLFFSIINKNSIELVNIDLIISIFNDNNCSEFQNFFYLEKDNYVEVNNIKILIKIIRLGKIIKFKHVKMFNIGENGNELYLNKLNIDLSNLFLNSIFYLKTQSKLSVKNLNLLLNQNNFLSSLDNSIISLKFLRFKIKSTTISSQRDFIISLLGNLNISNLVFNRMKINNSIFFYANYSIIQIKNIHIIGFFNVNVSFGSVFKLFNSNLTMTKCLFTLNNYFNRGGVFIF